jgi:sugar lactone lactonase YvrE
VIGLPVPCPTDLAFGGVDGQTLFVTSARDAIGREALDAAPLSGRLFAVAGAGPGVLPPVPASAGSPAPALT